MQETFDWIVGPLIILRVTLDGFIQPVGKALMSEPESTRNENFDKASRIEKV